MFILMLIKLDSTFREECNNTITKEKENYLKEVCLDLADPQVGINLLSFAIAMAQVTKLILHQILATGIYLDTWKLGNETPIHKKGDKQLVKNHHPICGKLLEIIVVNQSYKFVEICFISAKSVLFWL